VQEIFTTLRREGSTHSQLDKLMSFEEFNRLVRLESKYAAEKRYRS
jgi:hypothetical protein